MLMGYDRYEATNHETCLFRFPFVNCVFLEKPSQNKREKLEH